VAERVQGVARTQVFGMKGQNWVRLAKTHKLSLSSVVHIRFITLNANNLATGALLQAEQIRRLAAPGLRGACTTGCSSRSGGKGSNGRLARRPRAQRTSECCLRWLPVPTWTYRSGAVTSTKSTSVQRHELIEHQQQLVRLNGSHSAQSRQIALRR
jgi:hypothetical protein